AHPGRPHGAPAVMGLPMAVLAALSFGGGLLGARVAGEPLLRYLGPFFVDSATGVLKDRLVPAGVITALPVAVSLAGILAGFALYRNRREVTLGALGRFFSQQWYIETLYDAVIVTPAKRLAHLLADVVETRGIDGAVNGVGALDRQKPNALYGVGLAGSLAALALAAVVFVRLDPDQAALQFVERTAWIPSAGVSYHIGVDGISLPLVMLTAVIMPLALLSAWGSVAERVKEFVFSMLVLETA